MFWWNTKIVLDFSPTFSAIMGVSVIQTFNLIFFIQLIYIFTKISFAKLILQKYLILLGMVPLIFNFIYFFRNRKYKLILIECNDFSSKKRKRLDHACIIYTIISFALVFWAFINAKAHNI
jgi:hypothetical protein